MIMDEFVDEKNEYLRLKIFNEWNWRILKILIIK
jgi:hypothetical protein